MNFIILRAPTPGTAHCVKMYKNNTYLCARERVRVYLNSSNSCNIASITWTLLSPNVRNYFYYNSRLRAEKQNKTAAAAIVDRTKEVFFWKIMRPKIGQKTHKMSKLHTLDDDEDGGGGVGDFFGISNEFVVSTNNSRNNSSQWSQDVVAQSIYTIHRFWRISKFIEKRDMFGPIGNLVGCWELSGQQNISQMSFFVQLGIRLVITRSSTERQRREYSFFFLSKFVWPVGQ